MRGPSTRLLAVLSGAVFLAFVTVLGGQGQLFDTVILAGRVIDPETNLDAVRNIGIRGGVIRAVTAQTMQGRVSIDASGMVVAPGFIDLHQHARMAVNPTMYRHKAVDGVTTALELEVGTDDIDRWYDEREGKALINYGVSVGHVKVRMAVMNDPGEWLPSGAAARDTASDEQIAEMARRFERGLQRGAVAAGFGIAYTPGASEWELAELFRLAGRYGASAHVHMRGGDHGAALVELLGLAAAGHAPLHIVHIQSSQGADTAKALRVVEEARARGMDITTEMYPYTAGMNRIESAPWDEWADHPERFTDADFQTLFWPATGERLTRESFARYRKQGGNLIRFTNTEETVRGAAAHPLTMIASDGNSNPGEPDHPRTTATYTRVLAQYVREDRALSLPLAIRKMTLMPAQRLERRVPAMRSKGRIKVGADADIVVFDPAKVKDLATYESPARDSVGMQAVLVKGTRVVRDGKVLDGVLPGRGVRAPIQNQPIASR
jgi:N-acyl-D-aspartate/D-glutamate deacylase